jgi:hypothetical protein
MENTIENNLKVYTVLGAIALAATAAVAVHGEPVNTFMWVRGALLPVVAVLLYRLSVRASAGSGKAADRLRTLTVILPLAVVGVDLVPGVCPLWYAAMQTLCMIPVVVAAVTLRRAR